MEDHRGETLDGRELLIQEAREGEDATLPLGSRGPILDGSRPSSSVL